MSAVWRWHGLRTSRTLVSEVVVRSSTGREVVVPVSKRELLLLVADAARALERLEHAEELNRIREQVIAEVAARGQS